MKLTVSDKRDLPDEIIGSFEYLLHKYSIVLPNPEKDQDPDTANIYGSDRTGLNRDILDMLVAFGLLEPGEEIIDDEEDDDDGEDDDDDEEGGVNDAEDDGAGGDADDEMWSDVEDQNVRDSLQELYDQIRGSIINLVMVALPDHYLYVLRSRTFFEDVVAEVYRTSSWAVDKTCALEKVDRAVQWEMARRIGDF